MRLTEERTIVEWVRPNGRRRDIEVLLSREAAAILDELQAAGFEVSVEYCNGFYAAYIEDGEHDVAITTFPPDNPAERLSEWLASQRLKTLQDEAEKLRQLERME